MNISYYIILYLTVIFFSSIIISNYFNKHLTKRITEGFDDFAKITIPGQPNFDNSIKVGQIGKDIHDNWKDFDNWRENRNSQRDRRDRGERDEYIGPVIGGKGVEFCPAFTMEEGGHSDQATHLYKIQDGTLSAKDFAKMNKNKRFCTTKKYDKHSGKGIDKDSVKDQGKQAESQKGTSRKTSDKISTSKDKAKKSSVAKSMSTRTTSF